MEKKNIKKIGYLAVDPEIEEFKFYYEPQFKEASGVSDITYCSSLDDVKEMLQCQLFDLRKDAINKCETIGEAIDQQGNVNPEDDEERLKNSTIHHITMGDLQDAMGYAEEMATHGTQNVEIYSAEARTLQIALDLIKNELGDKYDDCHWFWRRDWKK